VADFPLGLVRLQDLQTAALQATGLKPSAQRETADIIVQASCWIESADVEKFFKHPQAKVLQDTHGHELLRHQGNRGETLVAEQSFRLIYPWHFLQAHERALKIKDGYSSTILLNQVYCQGRLQYGKGTVFLPNVVIEGDVVIGENCKIGPNCYIRGATTIGHRCHVGNAVEIKNSLLMDDTQVGHLSYVGDSIIGQKVNFGAGTITSNFRHDGLTHRSQVEGELINTGRRKLGAIIGDGVKTGIHTSIYPGRKIWPHQTTRPGDIVQRDLTPKA
jgi:bifunctional UDP-N-acetylglucosamine pyrophosphorylase/glucosamine-1-phosphate N-acetyltransferase